MTKSKALIAGGLTVLLGCGGGTTGGSSGTGGSGAIGGAGTTGTAGATGGAGTTGTAGTSGSAGTTGTAGTSGSAGTAGNAGTSGAAGSAATGGSSAGTGGTSPGSGGRAGTGGAGSGGRGGVGGGTAGTVGAAGAGGRGGGGAAAGGRGGTGGSGTGSGGAVATRFSFFVTSQAAMAALSGSANGFGGDLRYGESGAGAGLKGADKICTTVAERSMPGNAKTWRAFLSVASGLAGGPENAIDRVGSGPWYDRMGRVVALTKTDLVCSRPCNADPAIRDDLPNEDGVPNHNPGTGVIDNHNTMTGSGMNGQLHADGAPATCQDWTSTAMGQGFFGSGPAIGFSWPAATGNSWSFVIRDGGCAPGVTPGGGAQGGPTGTVGALGGYGGIYCFALQP